jgi:formylglycine-generating enzyme required for sulfatase activity
MLRAAVSVLIWLLLVSAAHAQKRVALLIGNQAYSREVGRLANPHNDVALLDKTLRSLGFEVLVEKDAGLGALNRAVNAYTRKLRAAGPEAIGFFYYSGHGAADGGTNYLIPVDVKTTETGELWDQSLRLTEITRKLKLEAGNATHFVVFDACRNTLKLTAPGSRSLVQSKGFVPVAQESGMLVAYATAEGELASDIGDGAGPYAKVLAEELVRPGIEAVVMFRAVQRRVRAAIRQEPYLGFNAMGDVYLAGQEMPKPAPSPAQSSQASETARVCREVEAMASLSMLAVLERQHRGTPAADCIVARMGELRAKAEAEKAQAEAERGKAAAEAERQRLALLEKQEEAKKAAEAQAQRICVNVGNILNIQLLGQMAGQHKDTPAADCIAARIDLLKKQQVAVAEPPKPQASPAARCDGVEVLVGNEKRCLKPRATFKDCGTCPEMVVVPAGEFIMGSPAEEEGREISEGPQRKVIIAQPFAVGRFEVTFAEWDECNTTNGCKHKPGDKDWGRTKRPVIGVSWDDITAEYLPWLSLRTSRTYRLPTEAEWEYAARAGTTTPFYTGRTITPAQANFDGTNGGRTRGQYRAQTVDVGSFQPNAFGLHDMHGNVWEWVQDCYKDTYMGAPVDGSAVTSGECGRRVLRGGAWDSSLVYLRGASRGRYSPDYRFYINSYGFRVARSLP